MVVAPGGIHIILECDDVNTYLLMNSDKLQSILEEASIASGATILSSHFHHFGGKYGVTGLVMLAESHISIHTWPEVNYAAIDLFMCGSCDPQIGADYIMNAFGGSSKIIRLDRKSHKS